MKITWVTELQGMEVRLTLTSLSMEVDRQAQADQAALLQAFVQKEEPCLLSRSATA